ncbi:winged helix-turn-helix domain-containing protein [Hymenobacter crusticola]|uniref:ModE family transcriptional regulator n=1 Tax=Hymenobacter crusticola TaxID=1770526 RepID=A0A243W8I8_9BACT|nr:LysR family transcriptional regulator [Hymenobacter crusticola]OUJ71630.1 ModE family transcriptional regulator [Hymenobacter crusticola]
MKDILLENLAFSLNGRLWIESTDDRFLGIGRLELLEKIETFGSISKAAQAMGMSYKKAWDLVSSMNGQVRTPLVSTQAGGKRGGGAALTPEGKQILETFQGMQARFRQFMEQETARLYE